MNEKEKNSFENKENVTDTKEQEYTFVKERVISKRVRIGKFLLRLFFNIVLPACVCLGVCYAYLSSSGRINLDNDETTEPTSPNVIYVEDNQPTEQPATDSPLSEEEELKILEEKLNKMVVVVAVTRQKTEEELAAESTDTDSESSSEGDNGESEPQGNETEENRQKENEGNAGGDSQTVGTSEEETTGQLQLETDPLIDEEHADKITLKYTGAIVSANGPVYILLPYSNIENSQEIVTYFHDGSAAPTTVYDVDYETGLALLKIEAAKVDAGLKEEIAAITVVGSEDIEKGSYIVYCGNVVGSEPMFIKGHISNSGNQVMCTDVNFNVVITDITLDGVHDGFLFNRNGKLVAIAGIDYKKLDMPGMIAGAEALDLRHIINNMLNGKKDIYLGIQSQEVTPEIEAIVGIDMPNGLYVNTVVLDSPAYNAGILPGDIIVHIGTVKEPDMKLYKNFIEGREKGDEIEVTVKRRIGNEYKEYTVQAILGSRD